MTINNKDKYGAKECFADIVEYLYSRSTASVWWFKLSQIIMWLIGFLTGFLLWGIK